MNKDSDPDFSRLNATVLGVAVALTLFELTSMAVALPSIGRDFGLSKNTLPWVINVYSVGFTACLFVAGSLCDRYGDKKSLLIGNMIFLFASLSCSTSPNTIIFFISRAFQGVGAAFLVTGAFTSIAFSFPLAASRARAFGIVGVVSGLSMVLGPSLAGYISSSSNWRYISLLNIAPCILIALCCSANANRVVSHSARKPNYFFIASTSTSTVCLLRAILTDRWLYFVDFLVVSIFFAFLSYYFLRKSKSRAEFSAIKAMINKSIICSSAIILALSFSYWAVIVYIPLYMESSFGFTILQSGNSILAATIPMLLLSTYGSRIIMRLGWAKYFGLSMTLLSLGCAFLVLSTSIMPRQHALVIAYIGMALMGSGAALCHPQLSGTILALFPSRSAGIASALTVITRQVGFAVGVAILGALTPSTFPGEGFAWPFSAATIVSICGVVACVLLPTPVTPD